MNQPYLFLMAIDGEGKVTVEGGLTFASVEYLFTGDPDYLPEEMCLQPSPERSAGHYVCEGIFTMEQVPDSSFDHYEVVWNPITLTHIESGFTAALHWLIVILNDRFQKAWEGENPPDRPIIHQGINDDRLGDSRSAREKAFADQWRKDESRLLPVLLNKPRGVPGVLWSPHDKTPMHPITQRDATVAATIIQWLGSNVGFCFLETALRNAGYQITPRK